MSPSAKNLHLEVVILHGAHILGETPNTPAAIIAHRFSFVNQKPRPGPSSQADQYRLVEVLLVGHPLVLLGCGKFVHSGKPDNTFANYHTLELASDYDNLSHLVQMVSLHTAIRRIANEGYEA
jgi:hypothetical protein